MAATIILRERPPKRRVEEKKIKTEKDFPLPFSVFL